MSSDGIRPRLRPLSINSLKYAYLPTQLSNREDVFCTKQPTLATSMALFPLYDSNFLSCTHRSYNSLTPFTSRLYAPRLYAPRLSPAKLVSHTWYDSQSFTASENLRNGLSKRLTIINIRRSLPQFGIIYVPQSRVGRKRTVTPLMIEDLCDHLCEKRGLFLEETAVFLWDEF